MAREVVSIQNSGDHDDVRGSLCHVMICHGCETCHDTGSECVSLSRSRDFFILVTRPFL